MVGDDMVNDILGAQAAGLTGILVRTGKYREGTRIAPMAGPTTCSRPSQTSRLPRSA